MVGNRIFYFSLIISLFLHIIVISFFSKSRWRIFKKPLKQIEVIYKDLRPKAKKEEEKPKGKDIQVLKDVKKPPKIKVISKKGREFSDKVGSNIRDISKLSKRFKVDKKRTPKISVLDIDQKIAIPIFRSEKITNPKYLSHRANVSIRIKENLRSYIDHPDFVRGYVYLSFILSRDGTLKEVKIIEAKTSANRYLKEATLESIKKTSPYPSLMQDFDYPEVPFSLLIEFYDK